MTDPDTKITTGKDCNPDPITGEPGAHPLGTGLGAASAGTTGVAIGAAVGGPVGALVGAAVGAVAGGLAGKGVAEILDPTVNEAYWQQNHTKMPFANKAGYDKYSSAYRTGYEGVGRHGVETEYSTVEGDLKSSYEKTKDAAGVEWEHAKDATRAAYDHVREEAKKL